MIKRKKEWTASQITRQNLDEKSRWRQIKNLAGMSKKSLSSIELEVNGTTLPTPQEVADHLNQFYVDKVQAIRVTTPPNVSKALDYTQTYMRNHKVKQVLEFQTVSITEVRAAISKLKMTSSNHKMIKYYKEIFVMQRHLNYLL